MIRMDSVICKPLHCGDLQKWVRVKLESPHASHRFTFNSHERTGLKVILLRFSGVFIVPDPVVNIFKIKEQSFFSQPNIFYKFFVTETLQARFLAAHVIFFVYKIITINLTGINFVKSWKGLHLGCHWDKFAPIWHVFLP